MRVSVVGLGKLGLPLAAVLSSKGHEVIGIDVVPEVVAAINAGRSPVEETGLQDLLTEFPFVASDNFELINKSEVTFVIVPTPSQADGGFSNQYVFAAMEKIGRAIREKNAPHLVVLNSTVMPGSSLEIRNVLETAAGNGVGYCYSPEFIALGSVINDMLNPDVILIGESDDHSGQVVADLMSSVIDNSAPVQRMNVINAELAKIALNAYVTMKISYANTLAEICEKLPNADANVVAEAIGLDGRIGGKYLRPATAFGGPCFVRDSQAFSLAAQKLGVDADLAWATDRINDRQVQRIVRHPAVSLPARVGVLGLAYKPFTSVTENSAGVALVHQLLREGKNVRVFDPHVLPSALPALQVEWSTTPELLVEDSDVVVVMTPWPEFRNLDFGDKFVVDCWGLVEGTNVIHVGEGT